MRRTINFSHIFIWLFLLTVLVKSNEVDKIKRLLNCEIFDPIENAAGPFIDFQKVVGTKPAAELVALHFFSQGQNAARVFLTSTQSPEWDDNTGYDIEVGACDNQCIIIRTRLPAQQSMILKNVTSPNVLTLQRASEIFTEANKDGWIRVKVGVNTETIVQTPHPIEVTHFTFDNANGYFYNCLGPSAYDVTTSSPDASANAVSKPR